MGNSKTLFILILGAFLLGALVLVLKSNYRRPYNIVSNRNFYSILANK